MNDYMEMLDNDEFVDFILTEYLKDKKMTDLENQPDSGSSLFDYEHAMACFKVTYEDRSVC